MIDQDAYEAAVNKWFKELKDIVTNDLLRQHINKYPVKTDYEIEAQSDDGREKEEPKEEENE